MIRTCSILASFFRKLLSKENFLVCHYLQEEHLASKKASDEALVCLSGVRCKRFAYGPADATATPSSLASLKFRLV